MNREYAVPSQAFTDAWARWQKRFGEKYREAMGVTEAKLQSSNNHLQTPQKAKTEKANG